MSSTKENGSKPRKKWGNDIALLDKLREIREKTGLKQEDFFKEYLSDVARADLNTDSSIQGFMRQLENDERPITPAILKRYAEIAKCSVDDLLNFDVEKVKNNATTFRELCRTLISLDEKFHFVLVKTGEYESFEDISDSEEGAAISKLSFRCKKIPVMKIGFPPRLVEYEWFSLFGDLEHDSVGLTAGYIAVNEFLFKYAEIKETGVKSMLTQEQWLSVVEDLLKAVPNDIAPESLMTSTITGGGNYLPAEKIEIVSRSGWGEKELASYC